MLEEELKIRRSGGTPSKEFMEEKKRLEKERIEKRRAEYQSRK